MKYGTHEWYLYHAWENEKPIIPLAVISFFVFFIKLGLFYVILIWIMYFLWARENNRKLDSDPKVLEYRRIYIEKRKNKL